MEHNLEGHIEALIFMTKDEISAAEIAESLSEQMETIFEPNKIVQIIENLKLKYDQGSFSYTIEMVSGGYKFMTKAPYFDTIANHLRLTTKKKLSPAAIETLAIIAYKQPVTKVELESIRGVNSDYSIQKLLDKELVEIAGRSDGPGRPLLYITSQKFMDYFGLEDLADLPKLKDFDNPFSEIGEKAPIEEVLIENDKNGRNKNNQ
ncbi:MAG TPA: SMC-Scp complex subunit ScpB [Saprospiraceae bacterium]|nr:SMC-Scp complex subunit ScpB [Saprospiraceae bacterium]